MARDFPTTKGSSESKKETLKEEGKGLEAEQEERHVEEEDRTPTVPVNTISIRTEGKGEADSSQGNYYNCGGKGHTAREHQSPRRRVSEFS